MTISNGHLLEVKNLKVTFRTDEGLVRAVDGIDFSVERGKTLGIVGESGSGKSVSTKAIMKLLPRTAIIDSDSQISFTKATGERIDIHKLSLNGRDIRKLRGGQIGMIFQEPMASFSPVYTIGNHMIEAIRTHDRTASKKDARQTAISMLERVGISNPEVRIDQYPFELSGGMRQRAMIAMALATSPLLLIADEPTTALDVTIQAQILALFKELQTEFDMGVIFISHDLGVISQVADEIVVMYLGRVMERGTAEDIINNPQHPYTQNLLKAIPKIHAIAPKLTQNGQRPRLTAIPGDIPSPLNRPTGCPFHTRCTERIAGTCDVTLPAMTRLTETHEVSCYLHETVTSGR